METLKVLIIGTLILTAIVAVFYILFKNVAKYFLDKMNGKHTSAKGPMNIYIAKHRAKMHNDRQYEDYVAWAHKNADGPAIKKMQPKELYGAEAEADKKIKNMFK